MKNTFKTIDYDRTMVRPMIAHIGVGNFHRAHEEFFTNALLERGIGNAGISGIMMLERDEPLYKLLKNQEGVYSLTICGRDGNDEALQIGSLVELLWAKETPDDVIDRLASEDIKIISLTITEGGYNIDRESGEFDLANEAVQHDLDNPSSPVTVFGYVAEALRRRRDRKNGPVTILTCDNLQHNGDTARKAFMTFIEVQDADLAEWADKNVTFPNSMVDRITPATTPEDVERLNRLNGTTDGAPVYCEDFVQWVIEDKFAAGRPEWEKVGVEFTDDVSAYENMKLSLLNASHTLLSYPSFLGGYRKVDEAMTDPRIVRLVREFMDIDITPYVPAPGDTDLELYKKTLIERFANRQVSDQVARLCFDGLSKFPVYITPNLAKMVRDGKDLTRVAYLIAAYRHYLKYHTDDNGVEFRTEEPWIDPETILLIQSDDPENFLRLGAFAGAGLAESEPFKDLYVGFAESIARQGAMKTLEDIQKEE